MRRVCSLLLFLLLLAPLAGCRGYADANAGRTVGEATDDALVHARVKAALLRDRQVSGLRIDVEVNKGVATLRGRVGSETLRLRALGIARDATGVRQVKDELVTPQ